MIAQPAWFRICTALALLATGGCATLSEHECQTADWESIGYRDGSEGHSSARIAQHAEACAEFGIQPDTQEYEAGRARGLEELFCTPQTGARIGRQGSRYDGVCSAEAEPDFLRGYELGRHMREIEVQMNELQHHIERLQHTLSSNHPSISETDREYMLYRLRDLEREFGRLHMQLQMLEAEARAL